MPIIPAALLKQLYQRDSLRNAPAGFALTLINHLAPATLVGLALTVDGTAIDPAALTVVIGMSGGTPTETHTPATDITLAHPLRFLIGVPTRLVIQGASLPPGPHTLALRAVTQELGPVTIEMTDTVA